MINNKLFLQEAHTAQPPNFFSFLFLNIIRLIAFFVQKKGRKKIGTYK